PDAGRYPPLDPVQEVDPVGRRPTGVGLGERLPGGRDERPEHVPLAPPPVVRRLPRPPTGHLLAREALGGFGTHLVEADDDRASGRGRVELLDRPLFAANSGSTFWPNHVS